MFKFLDGILQIPQSQPIEEFIPRIDVTNCDVWTVFSLSSSLFIVCTITVGHVTDDLYFRT
jgi:hypothetical protein